MLVRVLGPTVVERGPESPAITSRAVRSLLAGLALRAGSAVSVEALTGWVWGEDDLPEHPVPALQTLVSRLRRTLRETGLDVSVETVPGGYLLRIPPHQVDAVRFESLVTRARDLARRDHPETAVEAFDEALALWTGDRALVDITPSRAATGETVRLDELRLTATHERIDLLLRLRPAGELLAELSRLSSRHRLDEGFARQHMAALAACGRRADALEVYRRLAHAMHDELGLGPGPATRAAHTALLTEPPTSPVEDDDASQPSDIANPRPVAWPVRVGTPPALAAAFQVRHDLRHRIETALATATDAAVVVTQVMAGDGGVGKTQLGAALYYDAMESGAVDLGIWITATSRDAVLAAYAAAYEMVHPPAAAIHQEIEERAAAFLAWLAETDRPWMIVLDGVADPADLNQLRPRGSTGRVLITTRRRDAAMTAIGQIIDVGLFTPDESVAYLHERLDQPHHHLPARVLHDAAALAADLGHLPLALAQAAAVIINDAITCTDYRELLADRTLTLTQVFPADPRASGDDYTHALPAAWSLATERAAGTDPYVKKMLALVAVLDPNGIPENVLLAPPVTAHLGLAGAPGTGSRTARAAIRTAHQFSLLTHTPGDPTRSVRMHSLAQRAALEHLTPDDLAATVTVAADALLDVWPGIVADPDLAQVLRTNTTTLTTRHPDTLWHPDAHPVLFRVGWDLGLAGQVAKAVNHYAELLTRAQTLLGHDHPTTLSARYQLADWRGRAGDAEDAVTELDALLSDQLRVLGPDHRDTLSTRRELAGWHGESGAASNAVQLLERLAGDHARVCGAEDLGTLSARHDLAFWRGETGDVQGALAAFEEVLADTLRIVGPDHQYTLSTRHYLARAQGLAGDVTAAATGLAALLDDALRVLGPDNPYTLTTRHSLADWRGHAGDPATAVADLRTLLTDMLRVLGPDHVDTLGARLTHARWLGEAGDTTGAGEAFSDLQADTLRLLGAEHPLAAATRDALAEWGAVGDTPRTPEGALIDLRESVFAT